MLKGLWLGSQYTRDSTINPLLKKNMEKIVVFETYIYQYFGGQEEAT